MTAPPTPAKPRLVDCPGCRQPTPYQPGNPWRPFCSQRCRQGDLGAWAAERFRVAGPAADEAAPDEPQR